MHVYGELVAEVTPLSVEPNNALQPYTNSRYSPSYLIAYTFV